jgi:glycosyltransferase involved in cell wall biosynthesis
MKIVMLMSVYGANAVGGAERQTAILSRSLVMRGHTVEIVSLGSRFSAVTHNLDFHGIKVTHIPLTQIYDPYGLDGVKTKQQRSALQRALWHGLDIYNPWMVRKVKRHLALSKPDILFTHALQGFSVGVWGAARQLGIKVVHMVHDHALVCPNTAMSRGERVCKTPCDSCRVFSKATFLIASMPDAVVGPSQNVLDRHRQFGWFIDTAIQGVIPNALPDDWPAANNDSGRFTDARPLVFGFLGRLDSTKGADTLARAASQFTANQCQVRFGGAGDGNLLVAGLRIPPGVIEFCGTVNAAEFLANIDVLVTVSRAPETFCNVVMEAAALGVPAIVSDRGALPERVENGAAGWIVPAGNADALVKAMANCIENRGEVTRKSRVALASRSRYRATEQADVAERILQDVLSGKSNHVV